MKSRFLTVRDDCFTEVTLPSGSSLCKEVQVQVLLPAPNSRNPNPRPVGEGFGFLFVFGDM